jgi:hypothetical protein
MKAVWKYDADVEDEFTLEMPLGAEILTVQLQHENSNIWAYVDTDAPKATRHFRWYGTGHPMYDRLRKYIGTVQLASGNLIFHLFEE